MRWPACPGSPGMFKRGKSVDQNVLLSHTWVPAPEVEVEGVTYPNGVQPGRWRPQLPWVLPAPPPWLSGLSCSPSGKWEGNTCI